MEDHKVFAVIVTYKRAEILSQCLDAVLKRSTYKISKLHIIVNSNDEETLGVINKFKYEYGEIISYTKFDNCGPAGGFYYGIKEAVTSHCDSVWLMDDDLIPEPKCLERLLQAAKIHPYVFPRVFKGNGEEVISFGWWGVLLSIDLIKKVGLPMKEFFYWTEDTEYLQNRLIRKNKILPYRSKEAIVKHYHFRTTLHPAWYYYYTIRNTIYYRLNLFPLNFTGFWKLLNQIAISNYTILVKEDHKRNKLYYLYLGMFHGVKGSLGKLEKLHRTT